MSQYAGNNVFPVSFNLVDDGTDRDANSVNVGFEALADRTIWLKNHGIDTANGIFVNSLDTAGNIYNINTTSFAFDAFNNFILTDGTPTVGNKFLIDATLHGDYTAGGTQVDLRLGVQDGAGLHQIPGARFFTTAAQSPNGVFVNLMGGWNVTFAGVHQIGVIGKIAVAGTVFTVQQVYSLRVLLLK